MENKIDYSLLSTIRDLINEELLNVRTMLPAIVSKVDSTNCCVDVNLVINRVLTSGVELPIPTLQDLPVTYSGNGDFAVSFPVSVGDEGLVMFADRDIRKFLVTAKQGKPAMQRHHDLSDGVFIPFPISNSKRVGAETDTLLLKAGSSAAIRVKKDGSIDITGNVSVTGTLDAQGEISSAIDVSTPTVSLVQHTHTDSVGGSTSPPIPT